MVESVLLQTYKQYSADLLGYLTRRLRCRFTAADLNQDLYLRVAQMKEQPILINNTRAYLFRMAANMATDYLRVEGRRSELRDEVTILDEEPSASGPEQTLLANEQLQQVQQVLSRLPQRSRDIFFANRFEGKTQRQIAEELNVSTTTVENHIRQVFDALRALRDKTP
jgi:RNA polymerase sigma-70 factor (ECF subfamily)